MSTEENFNFKQRLESLLIEIEGAVAFKRWLNFYPLKFTSRSRRAIINLFVLAIGEKTRQVELERGTPHEFQILVASQLGQEIRDLVLKYTDEDTRNMFAKGVL